MWHIVIEALRNAVLITGLVVVMMMMIESLNIESRGMVFKGLKKTKFGQVVIASLLGSIPGCMGGFATVSLYTHRMFSFGALVAMMIASSGDEAFVMLAMIPEQALILFAVLFILAHEAPESWFWYIYGIQIMNVSGSVGDLYVTYLTLKAPEGTIVRDFGTSMMFYSPENNLKERKQ